MRRLLTLPDTQRIYRTLRRPSTTSPDSSLSSNEDVFIELDLLDLDAERISFFFNEVLTQIHSLQGSANTQLCLINNAAVFLPSKDKGAFITSLKVNVLGPLFLSSLLMKEFSSYKYTSSSLKLTIANISSGDGELLYLNSAIAEEIKNMESVEEVELYINNLIHHFDPSFEYAFGDSPHYTLSKALLNAATKALHYQENSVFEEKASLVRVVSICPANFLSKMTTKEELAAAEGEEESLISVEEAAENVVNVVCGDWAIYPGGKFYRNRKLIPW